VALSGRAILLRAYVILSVDDPVATNPLLRSKSLTTSAR